MSLVDLGKRLLDAAKRGDTDTVRALMSNGAPFTTDWLGTSPLHFAAQHGHVQTAEVLLRAGISRDARTKVDRTPLHVACQEGHVEIVDLLLQNAADIDAKDMLKMTPLHWSTEKGHLAIMETLLKHGADVHSEDKFDRTPLDIALGNGRTDLAQVLQLAQHTDIGGITEGETVTIETTEAAETVAAHNTTIKTEPGVDNSDQSSTSVLATLAALAEATAPINTQSVSSSDAMSWLESQGITMISTADGGIISSAVESGQTITLTEAGKIALNIIRQQGLAQADSQDTEDTAAIDSVVGDAGDQKVITIVTDQSSAEVPSEEGPVLVTVATDEAGDLLPEDQIVEETTVEAEEDGIVEAVTTATEEESTEEIKSEAVITEVDISHLAKSSIEGLDHEALRRQLEEVKKQAEEYKQQLKQKEQEAEVYKKQLSQIQTPEKANSE